MSPAAPSAPSAQISLFGESSGPTPPPRAPGPDPQPRPTGPALAPGLRIYRSNRLEVLFALMAHVLDHVPGQVPADPLAPLRITVGSAGMAQWLQYRFAERWGVAAQIECLFPERALGEAIDALEAHLADPPAPADSADVVGSAGVAGPAGLVSEAPTDPWSPDALGFTVLDALHQGLADGLPALEPVRAYLGRAAGGLDAVDTRSWSLARQVAEVFDRLITWRGEWARLLDTAPEAPELALPEWLKVLWQGVSDRLQFPHAAERLHRLRQLTERAPNPRAATERAATRPDRGPGAASPPAILDQPLRVFGLSSLPPTALERLALLARHTAVDLFVLCPSDAWWAELHRRRDSAQAWLGWTRDRAELDLRTDLPQGHPLLASLGRTLRDFQVRLEALQSTHGVTPVDVFVDAAEAQRHSGAAPAGADRAPLPGAGFPHPQFPDPAAASAGSGPSSPGPTALARLQSDLLHLREPDPDARLRLHPADDSLVFHDCAGAFRQVEALRDALLAALDADPALACREVVVMCSDIEAYAPLVTAVFDGGHAGGSDLALLDRGPTGGLDRGPSGGILGEAEPASGRGAHRPPPRLPYRLLDLSLRRGNPVAEALLRLLDLAGGRLSATALLDLLDLEPVRRRFGLDADGVATCRSWTALSGIRWAADAEDRRAEAQPFDPQNTVAFGLDRLFAGVATTAVDLLGAVAPLEGLVGNTHHAVLGGFAEFCAVVAAARRTAHTARPLGAWLDWLLGTAPERPDATTESSGAPDAHTPGDPETADAPDPLDDAPFGTRGLLDRFTLTPPESAWWSERVRGVLLDLRPASEDLDLPLDRGALQALLTGRFDLPSPSGPGDASGVTVSSLVPMRGQPHRIVALLGMDEGAFPRVAGRQAFDPVGAQPRLGDPSPADDDRGALLEALLAARDKLWIFYTGRDPRTQAPRPPCVPIAELREVVDLYFEALAAPGAERPLAAPAGASRWLTVVHPLQAFSASNFEIHANDGTATSGPADTATSGPAGAPTSGPTGAVTRTTTVGDGAPRGFDPRLCAAAEAIRSARTEGAAAPLRAFFDAEAALALRALATGSPEGGASPPEPPGAPADLQGPAVDFDDLRWFLKNPLAHFLRHRLKLTTPEGVEALADREPTELEAARWDYLEPLAAALNAGGDTEHLKRVLRAQGRVPLGRAGDRALAEADRTVRALAEAIAHLPPPEGQATLDQVADRFTLRGRLGSLRSVLDLRIRDREDNTHRPHWQVEAWLGLLARRARGDAAARAEILHVYTKAGDIKLQRRWLEAPEPDVAAQLLARLLAWYERGQWAPAPWLPEGGFAWVKAVQAHFAPVPNEDWGDALDELPPALATKGREAIAAAWYRAGDRGRPDADCPEIRRLFGEACPAFRGGDPHRGALDPDFADLALSLWLPLIQARKVERKPSIPGVP